MLNYHDYKALHLVGLIFFLLLLVRYHAGGASKYVKSFLVSMAFVTLSTGVLLTNRFGLLGETPPWIYTKYAVFVCLLATVWLPRPSSKLVRVRPYLVGVLIIVAVVASVFKPL